MGKKHKNVGVIRNIRTAVRISIYKEQLYFYIIAMSIYGTHSIQNEIKILIPLIIALKKMKWMGINLTKGDQDLCTESYTTSLKKIKWNLMEI